MFNFIYACFMLVTLILLLFSVDVIPNHSRIYDLAIPTSPPVDTSGIVDPSFLGFAFEQASFYNYSFNEDGTPNTFSRNLINAVAGRTGGRPILRVGGTSGDHASYDASQTNATNFPATEGYGPHFRKPFLEIGPSYFDAFKNFPEAEYIFMVPLSHRNLSNTIDWTRQGLATIGDRLQALEIGNEPDIYRWFNVSTYVDEFIEFQKALVVEFPDQLGSRPIFQALDGVWKRQKGVGKLNVNATMSAGLNATGAISQVAYHLYQTPHELSSQIGWLQRKVANHTAIKKNMARFEPQINYLRENHPGARFILSENGNTLGRRHREQRNNFATALWNIDYQLRAMAIGVDRVNNQQIIFPGYHMWEPVQSEFGPRAVWPNYYSQPFLADFIGRSGKIRVAEVQLPGNPDLLSAYVAYENDTPVRIAIVNFHLWTPMDNNNIRPNVEINLTGLWGGVKAAQVMHLSSPEGAYGTDFITWRGLEWTAENDGKEARIGRDAVLLAARAGVVNVKVEATSAVIVQLQSNWDLTVPVETLS